METHHPGTELCLGRVTTLLDASLSPSDNCAHSACNSKTPNASRKPLFGRDNQAPLSQPQAQPSLFSRAEPPVMAYQCAEPKPFKPRGMHIEDIPNRPTMVRAIVPIRPRPRNEDLSIITISPLPGNPLHFPTVEEVVHEFLAHRRVHIKEVQPCHLGQAFVHFEYEIDRDRMVLESPHP